MGWARVCVLLFLPFLVTYASGPSGCCSHNVTVMATQVMDVLPRGSSSSGSGKSYTTSIVESEYIVMFVSYYTTEARDGFISASLRPYRHWSILPRLNPAGDYPSDFSLVELGRGEGAESRKAALMALEQHPAVKQITPQKRLTRILTAGNSYYGEWKE